MLRKYTIIGPGTDCTPVQKIATHHLHRKKQIRKRACIRWQRKNLSRSCANIIIEDNLLYTKSVVPLADLQDMLKSLILSKGISNVKDSTKKHFRQKLESRFIAEFHTFPDSQGKLLVMPQSLDAKEVAC